MTISTRLTWDRGRAFTEQIEGPDEEGHVMRSWQSRLRESWRRLCWLRLRRREERYNARKGSPMDDITALTRLNTAVHSCVLGFGNVVVLRRTMLAGSSAATEQLRQQHIDHAKKFGFAEPGNPAFERWMEQTAASVVWSAQRSVDAASLVFAHSIIDDVAKECCVIAFQVDPKASDNQIAKREVNLTLANLQTANLEDIIGEHRNKHHNRLLNKSLLHRVDELYRRCKPVPELSLHGANYRYDRRRLEKLDEARHQIIHEPSLYLRGIVDWTPETIVSELDYLNETSLFLLWMIAQKYSLIAPWLLDAVSRFQPVSIITGEKSMSRRLEQENHTTEGSS
jgi:hypothetical protein